MRQKRAIEAGDRSGVDTIGLRAQHLALRECLDATGVDQTDDAPGFMQRDSNVFAPAACGP